MEQMEHTWTHIIPGSKQRPTESEQFNKWPRIKILAADAFAVRKAGFRLTIEDLNAFTSFGRCVLRNVFSLLQLHFPITTPQALYQHLQRVCRYHKVKSLDSGHILLPGSNKERFGLVVRSPNRF